MSENFDQTTFSQTAQLTTPARAPTVSSLTTTRPARKQWLVIAFLLGSCIFLIALGLISSQRKQVATIATPAPTVLPLTQEASDLEKRVLETEAKVQSADPFTNNYPLPPVDFHIRLKGLEELNR